MNVSCTFSALQEPEGFTKFQAEQKSQLIEVNGP